jgi:monoamine oxidase
MQSSEQPEHENPREERCDVVVIGAGAAGLVAASALAETADVRVLEAAARPGGRVESVRQGDYWLNIGAQFTEGSGPLFAMMDRHQIPRGSLAGSKAGLCLKGRIVATERPALLLLRSRMSLTAKLELAKVGLRIKRDYARLSGGDPVAARTTRSGLDAASGLALMEGIRTPEMVALMAAWSGQWIGCDPGQTAATQLTVSIGTALEKAAKVPNFALPEGGNQSFTDALAFGLGTRLRLNSRVSTVTWDQAEVRVHYVDERGPASVTATRAILAVPADIALSILPGLPEAHRSALTAIEYGRYVLAGVFTSEEGPQCWDDYYGISTPELSFQMVFNHAAPLRRTGTRRPGGALVCLSGGTQADELSRLTDAEIESTYLRDLTRLFPELNGKIDRVIVKRQPRVVPYWKPGKRAGSQQLLRQPFGPILFAGDYLGDPSLAAAAASGQRAAQHVRRSLAAPAGQ